MGINKGKNRPKSRRLIGLRASWSRSGTLFKNINGRRINIGHDFIQFFTSLDDKSKFKQYANKIIPHSPQWNAFRRKHLTASEIKRILCWRGKSAYIFHQITKYVSGKNPNRGMILEPYIIQLLKLNGYDVKYNNNLWIHKHIPWISCSTDGIIIDNDKFVAGIEIKTFTKSQSLQRTIQNFPQNPEIRKDSRIYFQIQTIAEVIDVPYVILIYEFQLNINKIVVQRDLDFIWSRYDELKRFYIKHFIPFYLYGLPSNMIRRGNHYEPIIDDLTYKKLIITLKNGENRFRDNTEESIFDNYSLEPPSYYIDEYFDFNTNEKIIKKLKCTNFKHNNLIVFKHELAKHKII